MLQVSIQGAFYELLHAKSFANGLENVVSRGGDTNTNGCIAGALLGARFGFQSIPSEWINTVKNAKPRISETSFLSMNNLDDFVLQLASIS